MLYFYIVCNSKTEVGYDQIFKTILEIQSFWDNEFKINFKTITTDNEDALNNRIKKYFPEMQSCYFH